MEEPSDLELLELTAAAYELGVRSERLIEFDAFFDCLTQIFVNEHEMGLIRICDVTFYEIDFEEP